MFLFLPLKKYGKQPMNKKLSHDIISDIKHKIFSGVLHIGERLPAERELAEDYNVSRITIRHAISRLVYLGFLQTIPQSGTFVADYKKNASLELLVDIISSSEEVDKSMLIDLLEIRRIFEIHSAGRAVLRMDDTHRKALRDMVNAMADHKQDTHKIVELDYKIHSLLIELADNNVLRLLFNSFRPIYQFYLTVFYADPENVTGILPYYVRFCDAADFRQERIASLIMGDLLEFAEQASLKAIEKVGTIRFKSMSFP
jgi:DNA-binding FadR family transcriptional regulator